MRLLLDPGARGEILERILRLTPDNDRLWEKMDCSQMLAHVGDQLRMALGDVPVNGARGVWRFALPRYLIIHVLPWPKGGAEAPAEAFTTAPTDWESDRATLLDLIERFAAIRPSELKPLHPLFGHLRPTTWGCCRIGIWIITYASSTVRMVDSPAWLPTSVPRLTANLENGIFGS